MTKDEALKLALEALELHGKQYPHMVKGYCLDAITAIKEALAQPEQEAVGSVVTYHGSSLGNAKGGEIMEWQLIGTSPFEGEKTAPWNWNDRKGKTAPWDENYVLVDVNGKVGAAFYESYPSEVRRGVYRATGWLWLHECGDCTHGEEIFPTHWMPYPPPVNSIA